MTHLAQRIRQARRSASLTQTELATHVHVHRSAVAQWERQEGSHPSAENLARVAIATHTSFDWLATGRGKPQAHASAPNEIPALELRHFARTDLEERMLLAFRQAPLRRQIALIRLAEPEKK